MSTPYAMQTLETVTVAGIIGDLYGNIPHLREVCAAMRDRGISVILSVGDLGLVDSRPSHSNLGWASETLAEYQQTLLFVDGNCDRHNDIYGYPVDTGGYRWTASNIAHLPRGFRTTLGTGLSFAALGGANSVDRPRPLE